MNGNLAVVAFAFYLSQWERHTISPTVLSSLRNVKYSLAYVSLTVVYAISGVMAAYFIFVAGSISGTDVGYCFALYLFLMLTRASAGFLLLPVIRKLGYKLNYKDICMLSFSGVRGVQTLVLMLTVVLNPVLDAAVTHRIGFQVSGIVLLTNFINAPTAKWVIRWLRLKSDSPEARVVLSATIDQMKRDGEVEITRLKEQPEFEATNWNEILSILHQLCKAARSIYSSTHGGAGTRTFHFDGTTRKRLQDLFARTRIARSLSLVSPSGSSRLSDSDEFGPSSSSSDSIDSLPSPSRSSSVTIDTNLPADVKQREDLTERFLELQRTEYHRLYDAGCLSRAATVALMRSIDASLDRRDLSQQWKVIESTLRVPRWLTFLYSSARLRRLQLFNRLVDRQVFLHFCVSVEVSSAFCRAKEKLCEFLEKYPVLSAVNPAAMEDIQRETDVYAARARAVFDDIRTAYPQVHTSLHSRHAILTLLASEENTLSRLHGSGLLSSVEFERIHQSTSDRYIHLKRAHIPNSLPSTEEVFLSQDYTRHMQQSQHEWMLARAHRLLLPSGQLIVTKAEDTQTQMSGLYIVIRGQLAVYYHRPHTTSPLRCSTEINDAFVRAYVAPEANNGEGEHEEPERLAMGSFVGARRLLDRGVDLCRTVTTCELLFFPLTVLRPMLTHAHFEESTMRAAGCELIKSSFRHLEPFSTMSADAFSFLLFEAASFLSRETNTATGIHSATNLEQGARLLLLTGHMDIQPPSHRQQTAVAYDGPTFIVILDGPVSLHTSPDCRWLVWKASDEQLAIERHTSNTTTPVTSRGAVDTANRRTAATGEADYLSADNDKEVVHRHVGNVIQEERRQEEVELTHLSLSKHVL